MTGVGRLVTMLEPGKLDVLQYPVPAPAPGALTIRVTRAHVCGSELHIWRGLHPVKRSGGLGHEMVGVVQSLGEGVTTDNSGAKLSVGDRVVATYFQTCRRCAQCRDGRPNLCDNAYAFFARQPDQWPHFHAAFATHYYVHPGQDVYRVPDQVPDEAAAGANCALAQAIFGLQSIGIGLGDSVLIQGAGGLGLSAAAVARDTGAHVIVSDPVAARRALALRFGGHTVVDPSAYADATEFAAAIRDLAGGSGPDIVVELTGVPEVFSQGLGTLRRGGRYLVMGNLSPGRTVAYDPGLATRRAIAVHHIDRYEGRYLWKALQFLEATVDKYPFNELVDASFTLDQVGEALDASARRTVSRAAIVPTQPSPAVPALLGDLSERSQ